MRRRAARDQQDKRDTSAIARCDFISLQNRVDPQWSAGLGCGFRTVGSGVDPFHLKLKRFSDNVYGLGAACLGSEFSGWQAIVAH
jgi:hypothetical protein